MSTVTTSAAETIPSSVLSAYLANLDKPLAILADADERGYTLETLSAASGASVANIQAYFSAAGLDASILANPADNWGVEQALARAGISAQQAVAFVTANQNQPHVVLNAAIQLGLSVNDIAGALGQTEQTVRSFFGNLDLTLIGVTPEAAA